MKKWLAEAGFLEENCVKLIGTTAETIFRKLRPFNSFNTEMKYPLLSALFHPLFQRFADRPVVEIREYEIVFLTGSVTLDNLQRSIQQFHLERHFCLVPFGQYPLLTIHFYDVAIG